MTSNCNAIRYDSCQETCQEYGLSEDVGNAYECTAPTEERITSSNSVTAMSSSSLGDNSDASTNEANSGALYSSGSIGLLLAFYSFY